MIGFSVYACGFNPFNQVVDLPLGPLHMVSAVPRPNTPAQAQIETEKEPNSRQSTESTFDKPSVSRFSSYRVLLPVVSYLST